MSPSARKELETAILAQRIATSALLAALVAHAEAPSADSRAVLAFCEAVEMKAIARTEKARATVRMAEVVQ